MYIVDKHFTFFVHLIGTGLCGGLVSAAVQLYTCYRE